MLRTSLRKTLTLSELLSLSTPQPVQHCAKLPSPRSFCSVPLFNTMPPRNRKRPRAPPQPTMTPPSGMSTPNEASFHSSSALSIPLLPDAPRFGELQSQNLLHPDLLNTITQDLKFDAMTPVQAATLKDLLQQTDCLAQARTGTGKTLAFLLPAIQRALQGPKLPRGCISALVITPTRELAIQIATEAKALLQRFPGHKVSLAIGGTTKSTESRNIPGSTILVATPGRLLDHLEDEPFQPQLASLQTLVLDEADRMLDMGFLPSIKKIITQLPNKHAVPRHSMLFSATLGDNIQNVAGLILNPGYKFISTIPKGEAQTHDRVPQFLINVPTMSDLTPALLAAVRREISSTPQFKAIVFASSARMSDFYGHVLGAAAGMPAVSVLHSRLSQPQRTKLTNEFRTSKNAICVATDVIARGMDFPNVTHVFQVGLPQDRDSYIHRLGRTARAEADGRGILILSQPEMYFVRLLKGISLQEYPQLSTNKADVDNAVRSMDNKDRVYQAFLGYYKNYSKPLQWSSEHLVQQANIFALQVLNCPEVPGIQKSTVGKMGLKNVRGLVVIPNESRVSHPAKRNRVENGGRNARQKQTN